MADLKGKIPLITYLGMVAVSGIPTLMIVIITIGALAVGSDDLQVLGMFLGLYGVMVFFPVVAGWLRSVWLGYMRYHAVPGNLSTLWAFRAELTRLWHLRLRRRSHKGYVDWRRMSRVERIYLPRPRVCHLYPDQRLRV